MGKNGFILCFQRFLCPCRHLKTISLTGNTEPRRNLTSHCPPMILVNFVLTASDNHII